VSEFREMDLGPSLPAMFTPGSQSTRHPPKQGEPGEGEIYSALQEGIFACSIETAESESCTDSRDDCDYIVQLQNSTPLLRLLQKGSLTSTVGEPG
jgi:hypothetical protein